MTIHISAQPKDIAETVLLPGDPLRGKGIADKLLDDVVCYNEVRGMMGYTGTFNGKRFQYKEQAWECLLQASMPTSLSVLAPSD
jgi:purine-nucleoside phosphorylase